MGVLRKSQFFESSFGQIIGGLNIDFPNKNQQICDIKLENYESQNRRVDPQYSSRFEKVQIKKWPKNNKAPFDLSPKGLKDFY